MIFFFLNFQINLSKYQGLFFLSQFFLKNKENGQILVKGLKF